MASKIFNERPCLFPFDIFFRNVVVGILLVTNLGDFFCVLRGENQKEIEDR
jgi:hypothetical protein